MNRLRPPGNRLKFVAIATLTAALIIWVGIISSLLQHSPSTADRPATDRPAIVGVAASPAPVTSPIPSVPTPSSPQLQPPAASSPPVTAPTPSLGELEPPSASPDASGTPTPRFVQPQTKYGHLPYREDDSPRLQKVGLYYDRPEYLDWEAAQAFQQMQSAAARAGVQLGIISGFRTIADQEQLFNRQIQRQGSTAAAARLSAPPGYSEHHTGYALDMGDRSQPNADLKYSFETTPAYQWLKPNARHYGFELSFPEHNPQGVSFEPWHWRYIGSTRAAAIFAPAQRFM